MEHIEGDHQHRTSAGRAMAMEHLEDVVAASVRSRVSITRGREGLLPTTSEGDSPAHLCATAGRADLLRSLASALGSGVVLEANDYGATPALDAVVAYAEGCFEVLEVLVAHGADMGQPNKEGLTPMHVAVS